MSRSEPTVTVTCDQCYDTIEIELTTTARGYDERNLDSHLEAKGWGKPTDDDGLDLCPDCMRDLVADEEDDGLA